MRKVSAWEWDTNYRLNKKERLKYNDLPERLQSHKNTVAFLDRYMVFDPFWHSQDVGAHISKDGDYCIYPY